MHGYTKPYFFDDSGRLFRDETGNLDHVDTIPMMIQLGPSNFGNELAKEYFGCFADVEQAIGTTIAVSVDRGSFDVVGEIGEQIDKITFKQPKRGRVIDYRYYHNADSDAPTINGVVTYYTQTETLHDGKHR
jgi:hypothetical protein